LLYTEKSKIAPKADQIVKEKIVELEKCHHGFLNHLYFRFGHNFDFFLGKFATIYSRYLHNSEHSIIVKNSPQAVKLHLFQTFQYLYDYFCKNRKNVIKIQALERYT